MNTIDTKNLINLIGVKQYGKIQRGNENFMCSYTPELTRYAKDSQCRYWANSHRYYRALCKVSEEAAKKIKEAV
jgi:hypothetical protein